MKQKIHILVTAAAGLAGSLNAATIALFNFEDDLLTSSDTETNTTVSSLTGGAGLDPLNPRNDNGNANNSSNVGGWLLDIGGDDTNTTSTATDLNGQLTQAISTNQYISFTLTIPDTYEVNLTSLTLDYEAYKGYRFAIGTFTSIDGFASFDDLVGGGIYDDNNSRTFYQPNVDLSGSGYQGLTETSVEFRIYVTDGSTSDTRNHFIDNIALTGTVAPVPEPSSFALLAGCFGLAWVMMRRR